MCRISPLSDAPVGLAEQALIQFAGKLEHSRAEYLRCHHFWAPVGPKTPSVFRRTALPEAELDQAALAVEHPRRELAAVLACHRLLDILDDGRDRTFIVLELFVSCDSPDPLPLTVATARVLLIRLRRISPDGVFTPYRSSIALWPRRRERPPAIHPQLALGPATARIDPVESLRPCRRRLVMVCILSTGSVTSNITRIPSPPALRPRRRFAELSETLSCNMQVVIG